MHHLLNESRILLVEDPGAENSATEASLRAGGYAHIEKTSDSSVIGLFSLQAPDLVILDAAGPADMDLEVLTRLTGRFEDLRHVLIFVVAGEESADFRARALELGAADLISRQVGPAELLLRVRNLLRVHYALLDEEGIRRRQAQNRDDQFDGLQWDALERLRLMLILSGKGGEAEMDRVGVLAEQLALALGASEAAGKRYRMVAPLRDIGQVTAGTEGGLRAHVEAGHQLLVGSVLPAVRLAGVIARTHHEHWDGSGCFGLNAKDIPLSGRVVAVVESFLARTGNRLGALPVDPEVALREVSRLSGTRFDPRVVGALGDVVREVIIPAEQHGLSLVRTAA